MHKKLESELVSLAHQILQMKNKNDVVKLKNKAKEVYEKLSVLDFVNNYFLTTPQAKENKKELLNQIQKAFDKDSEPIESTISNTNPQENLTNKENHTITNEPSELKDSAEDLEKIKAQNEAILKAEAEKIAQNLIAQEKEAERLAQLKKEEAQREANRLEQIRLEALKKKQLEDLKKHNEAKKGLADTDDFKDQIPADVAANMFEKASAINKKKEETPTASKEVTKPKQPVRSSVNDRVFGNKIQIGLNDRIAFVKHLFNFSQEDFNRVISQLNSFNSEAEAKDFLNNTVKPDYNWDGKEEYVERLVLLLERRFA